MSLYEELGKSKMGQIRNIIKKLDKKNNIITKISQLKSAFNNIRNENNQVAIKDADSVLKNINPNNEYVFQIMNH